MKKFTKVVSLMLAAILMMALCTACGGDSKKDDSTITFGTNAEFPPFEYVTAKGVIGEFDGIDMAIAKQIGEDNGMEAKIENMEFDSLLLALENGQVDAVVIDNAPAKEFVAANPGLVILDTSYAEEDYAIGMAKGSSLEDAVNAALEELKADGTLQSIVDKYITAE